MQELQPHPENGQYRVRNIREIKIDSSEFMNTLQLTTPDTKENIHTKQNQRYLQFIYDFIIPTKTEQKHLMKLKFIIYERPSGNIYSLYRMEDDRHITLFQAIPESFYLNFILNANPN